MVGIKYGGTTASRWSHRFVGTADHVPAALLHRDVADGYIKHVAKLSTLVLACMMSARIWQFHWKE